MEGHEVLGQNATEGLVTRGCFDCGDLNVLCRDRVLFGVSTGDFCGFGRQDLYEGYVGVDLVDDGLFSEKRGYGFNCEGDIKYDYKNEED